MSRDSKELEAEEQEVVEEEGTLADILAEQGKDEGEEEVVVPEDELPEDAEGLKAQLLKEREIKSKRNKSLKKSKDANHRIQGELEAALSRIEKLETSGAAPQPNLEAENREREKALEQWRKSVEDDPGRAVDFANWQAQNLQTNMAQAIADMKAELVEQLAEIKGSSNPDRLKYQAEMELVRSLPEYEDASESEVLRAAKLLKGTKVRKPRGGVGGRKAKATTDKKPVITADELRAMGFEPKD
jgi:hypothetical protein